MPFTAALLVIRSIVKKQKCYTIGLDEQQISIRKVSILSRKRIEENLLWHRLTIDYLQGGYKGFYSQNTINLTPKLVNDIHKRGGTILQTSRGGHDTKKIVDNIQDRGINQVDTFLLCESIKNNFLKWLLYIFDLLRVLGIHHWRRWHS